MADVSISYKNTEIATMNATGVKTLLTGDCFCEDDIVVSYTKPSATLQSKTVSPTTSQQTVSPDNGYDGLSSVTVNAMPSGSATTPATTITANPTISVSSGGLITASVSGSQSVTPTVSAGYVSSGTAGTVSVSGSNTSQLTTQAAQTIHPSTTDQTIASGKYLTGAQTVKGVLLTNLSAGNIKKDVVVKVGDSTDDDCVTSVTGTYEGGGWVTPAPQKQINFIDYDGTILYSYTKAEINAMTSESDLPANPSHTGLTAQGWNWTLAQIKAQLTAMPEGDVWVGQMYITSSGNTEIDVSMPACRLEPVLSIAVNGTIKIDWGDNTSQSTVTGTSLTSRKEPRHTYSAPGDYTISISVVSGSFQFYCGTNYLLLRKYNVTNYTQEMVYSNCVRAVRFGTGVTSIYDNTFLECHSLSYVTIPKSITSILDSAFKACYSLLSVTIPSGITNISQHEFQTCRKMVCVSIPSSVTSIDGYSIYNCYGISSVTIPNGVTSVGTYGICYCPALSKLVLPNNLLSIGNNSLRSNDSLSSIIIPNGLTTIGASALSGCSVVSSITIPSSVTSIGNSAFQECFGVKEYHFLPTSVPTGGTNMFASLPSDCVIYVPTASLNDYKTASNWSTYASYMQGE